VQEQLVGRYAAQYCLVEVVRGFRWSPRPSLISVRQIALRGGLDQPLAAQATASKTCGSSRAETCRSSSNDTSTCGPDSADSQAMYR